MNEIEKLYKKVAVKKIIPTLCSSNELYCKECEAHIENAMPYCKNAEYPPFTAEKQLELIKFLFNHNVYYDVDVKGNYWFHISDEIENSKYREFNEAIAECINKMWQDLTGEEKEQIRGVLNVNI